MKNLEQLKVNLQQGLFIFDGVVYGCYTHHRKEVWLRHPWTCEDVVLPKEFYNGYTIIVGSTDSIGLNVWTNGGRQEL